jgi:hypothetical protein
MTAERYPDVKISSADGLLLTPLIKAVRIKGRQAR